MKTIEQCKDEAAQEFDYKSYSDFIAWISIPTVNHISKLKEPDNMVDIVVNRAMELHTASALSSVREKLPDVVQFASQFADNNSYSPAYAEGKVNGAQWAINQVKELLK